MPARRWTNGDPTLKTPARRALRASIRADAIARGIGCQMPRCLLRTRAIDWNASWPAPASYVLDEILPRHLGGNPTDPTNVRPAHARCNAVAGVAVTNQKRRARARPGRPALVLDDW